MFRCCFFIVDKPELGPNIIETILMDYLVVIYEHAYRPSQCMKTSTDISHETNTNETMKTFHLLVDTLEPSFICEYLTMHFDRCLISSATVPYTLEQLSGILSMLLDMIKFDSVDLDIQTNNFSLMLSHMIETFDVQLNRLNSMEIFLCNRILSEIFRKFVPNDRHTFDKNCSTLTIIESTTNSSTNDIEHVRYLLDSIIHSIEHKNSLTIGRTRSTMEHMNNAIEVYQKLLHHFVVYFFIDDKQLNIHEKYQQIVSILGKHNETSLSVIHDRYEQNDEFSLKLMTNTNDYIDAFDSCCQLLAQFLRWSTNDSTGIVHFYANLEVNLRLTLSAGRQAIRIRMTIVLSVVSSIDDTHTHT
jgi:hypothetical protein